MHRWNVEPEGCSVATAIEIAARLDQGGVIAIPTETYYGLAAHFQNRSALARIGRLKARSDAKPFLLLVDGVSAAAQLCLGGLADLERLAAVFWPGPLTIAMPARPGLPESVVSAAGTVAMRHSAHPVAQAITAAVGVPITATSANVAGRPPVREVDQIDLGDAERLDGVVDAGRTPGGAPSTLLDLAATPARILRHGPITARQIRTVLGTRLL